LPLPFRLTSARSSRPPSIVKLCPPPPVLIFLCHLRRRCYSIMLCLPPAAFLLLSFLASLFSPVPARGLPSPLIPWLFPLFFFLLSFLYSSVGLPSVSAPPRSPTFLLWFSLRSGSRDLPFLLLAAGSLTVVRSAPFTAPSVPVHPVSFGVFSVLSFFLPSRLVGSPARLSLSFVSRPPPSALCSCSLPPSPLCFCGCLGSCPGFPLCSLLRLLALPPAVCHLALPTVSGLRLSLLRSTFPPLFPFAGSGSSPLVLPHPSMSLCAGCLLSRLPLPRPIGLFAFLSRAGVCAVALLLWPFALVFFSPVLPSFSCFLPHSRCPGLIVFFAFHSALLSLFACASFVGIPLPLPHFPSLLFSSGLPWLHAPSCGLPHIWAPSIFVILLFLSLVSLCPPCAGRLLTAF